MFHSSHKGHTSFPPIHFGSADATRFAQGQSAWSPALGGCAITRTDEFRWSIMINFISDFVLLGIMILGVLQKRNATYLWNMLYFQALFWILAATMTELPSVVCLPYSRGVHHVDSSDIFAQALSFKNINGESVLHSRRT
jgi:hypothetical protein